MGFDGEKEILRYAGCFLDTLVERCLKKCGSSLSSLQFPVFKKFLSYRVKRELQFYGLCLDLASVLTEADSVLKDHDLDELVEESIELDNRLERDITLLPLRIRFDYEKILPVRKERIKKQIYLFMQILSSDDAGCYHDMVRKAFNKELFLELNNDLLELYAEEAFIINASLKSLIRFDSVGMAHRMYCSMLDLGIGLNGETAGAIFSRNT